MNGNLAAPTTRARPAPSGRAIGNGPALLLHGVRLARSGPAEPWEQTTPEHLTRHTDRVGDRPRGTAALVEALDWAGLAGLGGAHVPAAVKWRAALRTGGPLTVVANGAESEPLGAKDATLLRQRPHLVLDGLALAAEALGARRTVVWLHGDDAGTSFAVQVALAQRRAQRRAEPWIEIVSGPGHYLAGASSAIGRALDGGPALPRVHRPGESSARARTLVHNVETLARAALIARGYPPLATTLLTVLTPADRQVLEVSQGTPATSVLAQTGWLPGSAPQAVLLGGFGGVWAPWIDLATFDEAVLRADGLSAGSGIIAPLARGACGITQTAAIAGYLAAMGARQCGPCLFGLPALAHSLRVLADGTAPRGELARLGEDLRAVAGRGACHHPDGAVRLIASALTVFGNDATDHAPGRPCDAAGRLTFPVPMVAR